MSDYPSLSTPLLVPTDSLEDSYNSITYDDFDPSSFNALIEQPDPNDQITDEIQDPFLFPANPYNEMKQRDSSPWYRLEPPLESVESGSTRESDDEEPFDPKDWMIEDTSTRRIRPPKLPEFLRLLLNNTRYISYASWLNRKKGVFKIHQPTKVVKLWRQVKLRKTVGSIDYDTFARCIRSYYKSGIMRKTRTRHTCRFARV